MSSRSGQGKDRQRVLGYNDKLNGAMVTEDQIIRRINQGNFFTYTYLGLSLAAFGVKDIGIQCEYPNGFNEGGRAGPRTVHMRFRTAAGGNSGHYQELLVDSGQAAKSVAVAGRNHNRHYGKDLTQGLIPEDIVPDFVNKPTTADQTHVMFDESAVAGGAPVRLYAQAVPATAMYVSDWWVLASATDADPYTDGPIVGLPYLFRIANINFDNETIPFYTISIDYFFSDGGANI